MNIITYITNIYTEVHKRLLVIRLHFTEASPLTNCPLSVTPQAVWALESRSLLRVFHQLVILSLPLPNNLIFLLGLISKLLISPL